MVMTKARGAQSQANILELGVTLAPVCP